MPASKAIVSSRSSQTRSGRCSEVKYRGPRISRKRLRDLREDLDAARNTMSVTVRKFWITSEHDIRDTLAQAEQKIVGKPSTAHQNPVGLRRYRRMPVTEGRLFDFKNPVCTRERRTGAGQRQWLKSGKEHWVSIAGGLVSVPNDFRKHEAGSGSRGRHDFHA